MGSLISSRRVYQTSSGKAGGRKMKGRSRSPDLSDKRSSVNRPVLKLKVRPETLSRHGIQTRNGVSDLRRSTLRKLAHSGVPYEKLIFPADNECRPHTPPPLLRHNLHPPRTHPPHTLPTPSLAITPPPPRRSHSVDALDSMIIIQYVENDSPPHTSDNSSSHPTQTGRESHLARLSYARMEEVVREEEHFGNITISKNGSPPVITPSTSLGMIDVCRRIQDHTHQPRDPRSHTHSTESFDRTHFHNGEGSATRLADEGQRNSLSGFQCSHSADSLSGFHSRKNWTKFQSVSEDEVCSGMEWSLGESVMRVMSQHGVSLFDLDNPTSVSEHEVNRAWPELRDKMKVWKSQQSLDKLCDDEDENNSVFKPLLSTSITITAH